MNERKIANLMDSLREGARGGGLTSDQCKRFATGAERSEVEALAWRLIQTCAGAAHDYCYAQMISDGMGRIVWHVILDDAIRLRVELAELHRFIRRE